MSEKNGNNGGGQWSKVPGLNAAVAAAVVQQQQQQQLKHQYELNEQQTVGPHTPSGGMSLNINSENIGLPYGTTATATATATNMPAYPAARFQAPLIHSSISNNNSSNNDNNNNNNNANSHLLNNALSVLTSAATSTATLNVPVPSGGGFIPPIIPPFPNNPATGPANVTSVLQPNPFSHPYGLEQLAHLNMSPHEMTKLINARNALVSATTTAAAAATASASAGSGSGSVLSLAANPHSNNNTQSQQAIGLTKRLITDIPSTSAASSALSLASASSGSGISGGSLGNAGAISSQIAENVIATFSSTGGLPNHMNSTHNRLLGIGARAPDREKLQKLQAMVENVISDVSKQKIGQILDMVATMKPAERLLLYLRLPGETPETDPLRQPQNPLGTRSEINHTINWVRSHLEHDPNVSIPKQDVYNEYTTYCERLDIKPLSTADFGKVMKQVFPGLKPRRLGTRGHSRYCYAAMRKTSKLPAPQLPILPTTAKTLPTTSPAVAAGAGAGVDSSTSSLASPKAINKESIEENAGVPTQLIDSETWEVIKNWSESMLSLKVDNIQDLATHIKAKISIGTPTIVRASNVAPKKYTPREPKEKRTLADNGPLKKRRKKKRKGSSSSESSCSQPTSVITANENQNDNKKPTILTTASSPIESMKAKLSVAEERNTNLKVDIKQEISDSPKLTQSIVHPSIALQHIPKNEIKDNFNPMTAPIGGAAAGVSSASSAYLVNQIQQSPHQLPQSQPINLATEQRSTLTKAAVSVITSTSTHLNQQQTSPISAFGPVISKANPNQQLPTGVSYGAVKNLTPKIIAMASAISSTSPAFNLPTTNNPASAPSTIQQQQQQLAGSIQTIKEEEEDYSPVYCKKVLKAHQTKGFWVNSPNSNSNSSTNNNSNNNINANNTNDNINIQTVPAITTTAATPPPAPPPTVIRSSLTTPATTTTANIDDQFLMGPPTQHFTRISPSLLAVNNLDDPSMPKVASRNYSLLKARRLAALAEAQTTSDLPEDLGLPRERVISICNMDKHELDGYLISNDDDDDEDDDNENNGNNNINNNNINNNNNEVNIDSNQNMNEDNSQDQDTELLQYFQMGDAEERKLIINSSSNDADQRNPAINQQQQQEQHQEQKALHFHINANQLHQQQQQQEMNNAFKILQQPEVVIEEENKFKQQQQQQQQDKLQNEQLQQKQQQENDKLFFTKIKPSLQINNSIDINTNTSTNTDLLNAATITNLNLINSNINIGSLQSISSAWKPITFNTTIQQQLLQQQQEEEQQKRQVIKSCFNNNELGNQQNPQQQQNPEQKEEEQNQPLFNDKQIEEEQEHEEEEDYTLTLPKRLELKLPNTTQITFKSTNFNSMVKTNSNNENNMVSNSNYNNKIIITKTKTTSTPAVVSASASLALMSKKHQLQQQLEQNEKLKLLAQQKSISSITPMTTTTTTTTTTPTLTNALLSTSISSPNATLLATPTTLEETKLPTTIATTNANVFGKRKIQVAGLINNNNNSEILLQAARKNYTFLPISPNINNTNQQNSSPSILNMNNNNNNINNGNNLINQSNNNNSNSNNNSCFASPVLGHLRSRTSLLSKQQSLDCDSSSDPMIGATRRRRSYINNTDSLNANSNSNLVNGLGATTSASAPPSPSVYSQFMGNLWLNNRPQTTTLNLNIDTASEAFLFEQDSLDLDEFKSINTINSNQGSLNPQSNTNTTNTNINNTNPNLTLNSYLFDDMNFDDLPPLTETQRSHSVPLSQLQRPQHSPQSFKRKYGYQNFSACPSMAPTPIPSDFIESTTTPSQTPTQTPTPSAKTPSGPMTNLFSENSNTSQTSNNTLNGTNHSSIMKFDDASVLVASDSTAMMDELLSLSNLVASNEGPTCGTTNTTCSSAGSSSGYNSATSNTLGKISKNSNFNLYNLGTVSRSVPSTPLPYQSVNNIFGNLTTHLNSRPLMNIADKLNIKDDSNPSSSLSPSFMMNNSYINSNNNNNNCNTNNNNINQHQNLSILQHHPYKYTNFNTTASRSAYDISKSMPTTPITTPHFSYSPTDFNQDFTINGNTLDSLTSSGFDNNNTTNDEYSANASIATDSLDNVLDLERDIMVSPNQVAADLLGSL